MLASSAAHAAASALAPLSFIPALAGYGLAKFPLAHHPRMSLASGVTGQLIPQWNESEESNGHSRPGAPHAGDAGLRRGLAHSSDTTPSLWECGKPRATILHPCRTITFLHSLGRFRRFHRVPPNDRNRRIFLLVAKSRRKSLHPGTADPKASPWETAPDARCSHFPPTFAGSAY